MNIAFCIGNGESRRDFDLERVKPYGTMYGANAIHRDTTVDHLVCCDQRMAKEAMYNNYVGPIYTRDRWYTDFATSQVKPLPNFDWPQDQKFTQTFHWGSGLHAVHLACRHGANICVMIGHDFYGINDKHNNLYKATPNYESAEYRAVDPSFWIRQFGLLFAYFPRTTFIFCQPDINTWTVPHEWDNLPMVVLQNTEDMVNDLYLTQG